MYGAILATTVISKAAFTMVQFAPLSDNSQKKGVIAAIKRSSQLTKKMGYAQVVGTFIVLMGAKIIICRIPLLGWLAAMALEPFIMLIPGLLYLTAQDEQIKTSENTVISGQSISQS